VSDGAYQDYVGSARMQLHTKYRILIRCQTPGTCQDQSAYRSELIGILATGMAVSWLIEQWGANESEEQGWTVTMACDGLAALRNSISTKSLRPKQRQFDLPLSNRRFVDSSKKEALPGGPST